MIIIQIVFWVLFMYGFLSLIQDIVTEFTYKKYNKHIKVFVCIDDFENQIENFERELSRVKWQFKNIGINIVNMDSKTCDYVVKSCFKNDSISVLSKDDYIKIVSRYLTK